MRGFRFVDRFERLDVWSLIYAVSCSSLAIPIAACAINKRLLTGCYEPPTRDSTTADTVTGLGTAGRAKFKVFYVTPQTAVALPTPASVEGGTAKSPGISASRIESSFDETKPSVSMARR